MVNSNNKFQKLPLALAMNVHHSNLGFNGKRRDRFSFNIKASALSMVSTYYDIFFIWNNNATKLKQLLKEHSDYHPNPTFIHKFSKN